MKSDVDQSEFQLARVQKTLPIALLRAREAIMQQFRPMLQEFNISEQQWRVLRVIRDSNEIEASELATAACVLPPSLSRMLKALQERGFIRITSDPCDARRYKITLSRQGEEFVREVSPHSAQMYHSIEQQVGRDNIDEMLTSLNALLDALGKGRR